MCLTDRLPETPVYNPARITRGQQILGAGHNSPFWYECYFRNIGDDAEWQEIIGARGPRYIFLWGYVKYDDVVGREHIYRFGMKFYPVLNTPGGFVNAGNQAYNQST